MMDINLVLLQWSTLANKSSIKNEIISNKELAEELHKPIIRKLEKIKVYSPFLDNIWDEDLTGIQLISKFNKDLEFYYVNIMLILIFIANISRLTDKKYLQLLMVFKTFQINLIANEYEQIRVPNFAIDQ